MNRLNQVLPGVTNLQPVKPASGVENFWAAAGGAAPLVSLVHDVRNLVSALRLYCELLKEPGVLSDGQGHFAGDLRMVADATSRIVEQITWIAGTPAKLVSASNLHAELAAESVEMPIEACAAPAIEAEYLPMAAIEPVTAEVEKTHRLPGKAFRQNKTESGPRLIEDMGAVVRSMRPLLSAMAGAAIALEVECLACTGKLRLSPEDLTRILMNLVCNASEAMSHGGTIRITAQLGGGGSFLPKRQAAKAGRTVLVAVQDSGTGIEAQIQEHVFDAGFSTKIGFKTWPANAHRGLGLSIARELVEMAGGSIRVVSQAGRGARFELEFPILADRADDVAAVTDIKNERRLTC